MQMKRLIIILALLVFPSLVGAQTIQLSDWNHGQLYYLRHHEFQRPWAYEIEVAVFNPQMPVGKGDPDAEHGYRHIQGIILQFKQKPKDEKEVTDKLNTALQRVFDSLSEPPPPEPEKQYTESEVVQILVEKKYLVDGQKLEDMAVKEVVGVAPK